MFDELPETIPHKSTKKLKTFAFAAAVQVVLVTSLIIIQMAAPEKLGEFQLLTTLYMAAPPPPPPAPAPGPAPRRAPKAEKPAATREQPAIQPQPELKPVEEKPQIVAPTAVPKDIARIVEAGTPSSGAGGGIPGGVPGGIPGGINGGAFGGVLGGVAVANIPPPPPTGPVRVGGNVKQPKVLHIEQPHYPPAARKARIEGVVIIEATVTAEGNVDKVKVVSGPPMLTEAAAEAVSHWKYEPTYLNGQAVPVILTARISFSVSEGQQ
jgi:protein TonB